MTILLMIWVLISIKPEKSLSKSGLSEQFRHTQSSLTELGQPRGKWGGLDVTQMSKKDGTKFGAPYGKKSLTIITSLLLTVTFDEEIQMIRYAWFDMDGTLSDDAHRHNHMLTGNWDKYHELSKNDPPIEAVGEVMQSLRSSGMNVGILTSRPMSYRQSTQVWLTKHFPFVTITALLMRPQGDWRPSGESKVSELDKFFRSREIALKRTCCIFDDRDSVAASLREAGFTVFDVHRTVPEYVAGDKHR